ncbi:DUF6313 family protein [Streptomyces nigra]|uniref:DUF6313 family protein n=1 Tax=Streptomyces nigra TaxID=1827580 RepID=UPI00341E10E4
MTTASSPSAAPPRTPPPRPTWPRRVRRWWRSRDALSRVRRWLLLRALPGVLVLVALFVVNGVLDGWVNAYNLLVGIDSPGDAKTKWCAWLLSATGWAAVPAFIGGFVGYLVTQQIDSHRQHDVDVILAELRRASLPTQQPPGP